MDEQLTAVLQKSPVTGGWTYELPVRAELRRAVGKEAGDSVSVHLLGRFDP